VATIISRKKWGAAPPQGRPVKTKWTAGGTVWVHHTEGTELPATTAIQNEYQVMRSIQRFHQKTRGWSDIGYSYVIFPSGRIYEGRCKEVVGAHCPGHNAEPGVAFAGSFDDHVPTNKAWSALGQLSSQLGMRKYKGHRDGFSTSCPGNALYNKLRSQPPVTPKKKPKLSVYQRLRRAGFGVNSAKQILRKMGRIK